MSINPAFRELFPRSMLLVCIEDHISCSLACKCALLVGWWHRMEWPLAFLRRPPMDAADVPRECTQVFSRAGDRIFDLSDECAWRDSHLRALLTEFGAVSITLAGSGLHDVLLGTAIAANAAGIPTTVVTDAVDGRALANVLPGSSTELLLSLLKPFAMLMPTTTFVSVTESGT